MTLKEYQKFVEDNHSSKYDTKLAIIGLVGEVGELADVVKKENIYEDMSKFVNKYGMSVEEKIKDEAGDVLWQLTLVMSMYGWSIQDVLEQNVKKLTERHSGSKTAKDGGLR